MEAAKRVLANKSDAPLTGPNGKPLIFYFGAEFCPYCAAERWPLIVALSRFGTFTGLSTTTSSSSDAYPNTPTFTFRAASYTSDYVSFQAVEASDPEWFCIGVQWHPEADSASALDTQLFECFVQACLRQAEPLALAA